MRHTSIILNKDETVTGLEVSDASLDYGRADKEGREQTCALFAKLLQGRIPIVNVNPTLGKYDKLVKTNT